MGIFPIRDMMYLLSHQASPRSHQTWLSLPRLVLDGAVLAENGKLFLREPLPDTPHEFPTNSSLGSFRTG